MTNLIKTYQKCFYKLIYTHEPLTPAEQAQFNEAAEKLGWPPYTIAVERRPNRSGEIPIKIPSPALDKAD